MRGEGYLNLKNGKESETDLKNAIGLSPSSANIWFRLAENYQQNLKDNQKALEAYIKVNAMTKGSLGWMECSAVLKATAILRDLGRNEEVLKILETSDREKESPYRMQKYSAYVDALTALDRKAEAIAECNKFLQLKISVAEKIEIEKKLKILQGEASQPPGK